MNQLFYRIFEISLFNSNKIYFILKEHFYIIDHIFFLMIKIKFKHNNLLNKT